MEFHGPPPLSSKIAKVSYFIAFFTVHSKGTIFLYKSSVKLLLNGLSLQNRFL